MLNAIINLQDRYKTFLFIFAISISAILLVMFGKDNKSAFLLSIIIGVMLFLGKPLWFSSRHGDTMVRMTSLLIASSAAVAFVGWRAFVEDFVKALMKDNYPKIAAQNQEIIALLIFLFLSTVIYIVNRRYYGDNTGMGVHPRNIDKDIPEPSFQDRLYAVCGALTDDLKIIDNRTNWSTHHFTPLDAEVEVNTKNGSDRKITDLLKAIKNSKKRLFLVLGPPGAGKSVALRKLCQDLASEVKSTGKIPIYVNLREWQIKEKWSERNPPTVEQLAGFVKANVMNRDIVTTKFFKQYFDKLYETGRLYFVFDSFDEIPAVLNERENSELIHKLSEVIFKFLKGARQESQGILASRMFRKPTVEFQTEVTLEIRPFTEEKIIQTFRNTGSFDDNLIKQLFIDRPELVPIARNPFSAVLIAEYADECGGELPPNQTEMYASYINQTLRTCENRILNKGLTIESVIASTLEIANIMFRKYGLEASVISLSKDLPSIPVEDVVDILKFARLGRAGSGDDNIFSFSHRRFTEYFTVKKMIDDNEEIEYQAIPKDSQWRDALVLYCEVVDTDKAKVIANYCWKIINDPSTTESYMIHSLRFLRDAFRGRTDCTENFRKDLGEFIYKKINSRNDVLSIKLAIEVLPLLEDQHIQKNILKALSLKNKIINDSSINIYRNLSIVSDVLANKVASLIKNMPIFEVLKERKALLFSLSLSKGFEKASRVLKIRIYAFYFLIIIILVSIYTIPELLPITLFFLITYTISDYIFTQILSNYRLNSYTTLFINSFMFSFLCLFLATFIPTVKNIYDIKEVPRLEVDETTICKNTKCYLFSDIFSTISAKQEKAESETNRSNMEKLPSWVKTNIGVFEIALLSLSLLLFYYSFMDKYSISLKREYILLFTVVIVLVVAIMSIVVYLGNIREIRIFFIRYSLFFYVFYFMFIFILFIHMIVKSIKIFHKRSIMRKNIQWRRLTQRKYIYQLFSNPEYTERLRQEIVTYIENNVKNPLGEWPDKSIFMAKNRSDSYVRLAKLEQKWIDSK